METEFILNDAIMDSIDRFSIPGLSPRNVMESEDWVSIESGEHDKGFNRVRR